MNSLCPRQQHDACRRSSSQPRSAGPPDELIWPKQGDPTAPQLDKAERGMNAQDAVDVLWARSHEACKGLL